jgi:hypothetical protein
MSIKFLSALALTGALLASSGCATLFASGPSEVDIAVDQPANGATIAVRGIMNDDAIVKQAQAYKATLDRRTPYAVAVTADGYKPQVVPVKLEVNPAYWLDLLPLLAGMTLSVTSPNLVQSNPALLGGLELAGAVGMLVDLVTANAYRHSMVHMNVSLDKAEKQPQ